MAPGVFIVVAIFVLVVLVLAYGLFTREGSGIEERPWDGSEGAPGAAGPDERRSHEETDRPALADDYGNPSALSQHGTDSHASERDAQRED